MRRRENVLSLMLLLCAVGVAGVCVSDLSAAERDYQLVWSDEFDGTEVDPLKWSFQIGDGCPNLCGWGNNELEYYRAENATVSGGLLTIAAREEFFGGRDYTSSRLRTVGLGDWEFGRFEMRAQLPEGQGLWPAFWMLSTDDTYGTWAASGEIDIMEYIGSDADRVFGTLHFGGEWPDNAFSSRGFTLPSGTFADGMHDFAFEWGPHEMRWYVDDQLFSCQSHWTSSGAGYPAPFDERFHLLLNMAVGGNLPGPPGATQFPKELVVDHVRVHQRPEFPQCDMLFDGMDHANPYAANWFLFNGNGSGSMGASGDIPPGGCNTSLSTSFNSGGSQGFLGGLGRNSPRDLSDMAHFSFWINPDAGQDYVIEINLQDDDNGDNVFPGTPDGSDDEYQFDCHVSPTGACAIAGGGWQRVSIPLASFYDDSSFHFGGNGVLDPFPVDVGGNGQLINVVLALISNSGANVSFRTDRWMFSNESALISGRVWSDTDGDGTPDGGEPGLNGVTVELQDLSGSVLESTTTSGDGDYQFAMLPWGEYNVAVESASLPLGSLPTGDPDGLQTPNAASSLIGCLETSSGQDFGYSAPPSPTGSILVAKNGSDLEISYDISCNAADHALLYGELGGFTTVTAADCLIGVSGSTISSPSSGSVWFLVAGRDEARYSSVGQSTAGERMPTAVETYCTALLSQDVSTSCP